MRRVSKDWYTHFGVKIPKTLGKAIDRYLTYESFPSRSEFVKCAIRAYLQKYAPGLLEEVIAEKRKEANQNE